MAQGLGTLISFIFLDTTEEPEEDQGTEKLGNVHFDDFHDLY